MLKLFLFIINIAPCFVLQTMEKIIMLQGDLEPYKLNK